MDLKIPPYVYSDEPSERSCLQQGDIIKVQGNLIDLFNEFYPTLNHTTERDDQYIMVLSQSCDLVRETSRNIKIDHINVCLVRTIDSLIKRKIEKQLEKTEGKLTKDFLKEMTKSLIRLMNNSETKFHFFLPKHSNFPKDMISILSLSYSFRAEHYDLLLENRVVSLKPEFIAKIGMILATYYGRVATRDLQIYNWDEEKCREYAAKILIEPHILN